MHFMTTGVRSFSVTHRLDCDFNSDIFLTSEIDPTFEVFPFHIIIYLWIVNIMINGIRTCGMQKGHNLLSGE